MKSPLETYQEWSKKFGTTGLFGCAELEIVALAICEQVKYSKEWTSAVVDIRELQRALNLQEGHRADWLFNHCHLGPDSAHKCSVVGDLINEDGTLTERFIKKAARPALEAV